MDEPRRPKRVGRPLPPPSEAPPVPTPPEPAEDLTCNRCGFPVPDRVWGCKNPCANCGTVYPLGDCSD